MLMFHHFSERVVGFFTLSLLLHPGFLQVLPCRRYLSSVREKELARNRFQTDKGAIESCSLLFPVLILRMDYVHRCLCAFHFHPHFHLAFGSNTEEYFILCRVLSSFIYKSRDLSLTAQMWIHWSRNTQKNTWAHIIYHLCLYLQLLPDLLPLGEYLPADLSTTVFEQCSFKPWPLWVIANKKKTHCRWI